MAKKNGIKTPDGYFDSLQSRLISIADTAPSVHKTGFVRKVAPYFAYAVSFYGKRPFPKWKTQPGRKTSWQKCL